MLVNTNKYSKVNVWIEKDSRRQLFLDDACQIVCYITAYNKKFEQPFGITVYGDSELDPFDYSLAPKNWILV